MRSLGKPKTGRPLTLTPEVHEKIVRYLRIGNYMETAAAAAGVASRTTREWLQRGAKGEEPFAAFAADVEQAIAESEAVDVAKLAQLARGSSDAAPDTKALTWRLERRFRDRWGASLVVVTQVREEATEELLGRIRQLVDQRTFGVILMGLSNPEDGVEGSDRVDH